MLTRAEERLVRDLGERRRRAAPDLFLAEGVRVVEEVLATGVVLRMALVAPSLEDTPRGQRLARRLAGEATTRSLSDGALKRLAGTRSPQGVLAVAECPVRTLDRLEPAGPVAALVLDGVQDPGNVGTLARSAAAFGVPALICLPGTVDPWNAKAVRASAGALFRVAVVEAELDSLRKWLEAHGVELVGAAATGDPVSAYAADGPVALAVGNEGAGVTPAVGVLCGRWAAVPMRGGVESLNVAVAAGILLYELTRERV